MTTALASAGALLGGLGMGSLANFFRDSAQQFETALNVDKDIAKAQRIIEGQEMRIRDLQVHLEEERLRQDANETKIDQLEEVVCRLNKMLEAERYQLRAVRLADE